MKSLDAMKKRLDYHGGQKQQDRMIKDKLHGLERSLLYSYQGGTCVMPDDREFRMLMNPDKLKPDYDHKIISIPFADICLNKPRQGKRSEGIEEIGMKPGVVFQWKQNQTYWICYSQYLEEYAYFRGDVYCCEENIADVNGKKYHVYFKGPDQQTIDWHTKSKDYWNTLNYTKIMWITKDEDTLALYHRFAVCEINGQKWEVQVVNPDYGDGIIKVWVKEYWTNTPEDMKEEQGIPPVEGMRVYPYETYTVSFPYRNNGESVQIANATEGIKVNLDSVAWQPDNTLKVDFTIKKNHSGEFDIFYGDDFIHCIIESL